MSIQNILEKNTRIFQKRELLYETQTIPKIINHFYMIFLQLYNGPTHKWECVVQSNKKQTSANLLSSVDFEPYRTSSMPNFSFHQITKFKFTASDSQFRDNFRNTSTY